jgi:hypothetical protein
MRKGARLVLGAFVVLLAAVMLSGRPHAQPEPPRANGIALLYVPGPFDEHYEVSAEMRLPRIASNGSWYCVWLMLVDKHDAAFGAPFVQGGLMRWQQHAFNLTAFIAEAKRAKAMTYDDVGGLGDGWHRVALRGDAEHVDLVIDGKMLHRFPRTAYLADAEDVYLQIGAEVVQPNDTISASVRDVRVKRDTDTILHPEPIACDRYDRGLRFEESHGAFQAGGRFVPAAESGYDGCTNFDVDPGG